MWSVLAQITVNILQFLSIEGQRQITEMCWHKSQLTYYNFFLQEDKDKNVVRVGTYYVSSELKLRCSIPAICIIVDCN